MLRDLYPPALHECKYRMNCVKVQLELDNSVSEQYYRPYQLLTLVKTTEHYSAAVARPEISKWEDLCELGWTSILSMWILDESFKVTTKT